VSDSGRYYSCDADMIRDRIAKIEADERQAFSDAEELKSLRARLPAFERLFHAVSASPCPLTGEIAAAFYALRVQEFGA
jgi:hypothetical protein